MDPEDNPFANSNVRILLGLSSALIVVFVAFFFVDDTMLRWLMVAIAAMDAVVTPYILKMAVEDAIEDSTGQQV
jgi:predicted Co/Zn/Cd cation transporter (cation efflux family)